MGSLLGATSDGTVDGDRIGRQVDAVDHRQASDKEKGVIRLYQDR